MASFTIFTIFALVMSVVAHELAHGYAAGAQGDPTARLAGRLTINPIAHIDWIGSVLVPMVLAWLGGIVFGWAKPVPVNPYNLRNQKWGEALVAAAGPAVNLIIALVCGLLIRFEVLPSIELVLFAQTIVLINLVLALFNLMPIPPLDGSKILFAVLPYQYQRFRSALERWGFFGVLLFIFVLWQFFVPVIGFLAALIIGTPVAW